MEQVLSYMSPYTLWDAVIQIVAEIKAKVKKERDEASSGVLF